MLSTPSLMILLVVGLAAGTPTEGSPGLSGQPGPSGRSASQDRVARYRGGVPDIPPRPRRRRRGVRLSFGAQGGLSALTGGSVGPGFHYGVTAGVGTRVGWRASSVFATLAFSDSNYRPSTFRSEARGQVILDRRVFDIVFGGRGSWQLVGGLRGVVAPGFGVAFMLSEARESGVDPTSTSSVLPVLSLAMGVELLVSRFIGVGVMAKGRIFLMTPGSDFVAGVAGAGSRPPTSQWSLSVGITWYPW